MTRHLRPPVRVYRVGGSVRDELLGLPAGDADWVVVGATPEMMIASGYRPVGRDFPVFLHPETKDEYALARTERKHGRGYRGFEFFATPDVTLEEDLRRRDLTINAMARDEAGILIDPYGGERDLENKVLRHVSEAFAEDPLRILRVARFAARFDFAIADETLALMREIVASGELATIAPERVWAEVSRGLCEAHPSRMLAALRACDALATLLPEIEALYSRRFDNDNAGALTERALEYAAAGRFDLRVRYAVLAQELDIVAARGRAARQAGSAGTLGRSGAARKATRRTLRPPVSISIRAGTTQVEALSRRLRVPVDCRDAARLSVRWHRKVARASALAPAEILALVTEADALRRPERLDALLESTTAHVAALPDTDQAIDDFNGLIHEAVAIVRSVDAAAIARDVIDRAASRRPSKTTAKGDAVRQALREARLAALRAWKRQRRTRGTVG
jgi:tRNA nucleotidyltransferase (CCA-adding enzyme)